MLFLYSFTLTNTTASMKKIYLLVVLFLSLFSLNSFAKSVVIRDKIVIRKFDTNLLVSNLNLILAAPTSSPKASSTSVCEGESLTLTANPSGGIAPYTFSWTGPNGYVSTNENPVITNIGLSGSGIYSLVVTDALNATSTIQSTEAIVINAKIDPEFDATLPAICKDAIAPLLSTTSTNGIIGTWNPSVVSNTATATYLFTPDSGQCANTFSFTVFVVKNVTPIFTLPPSICFGATPPVLNNISNNGIVGTWNPATVRNTTSGTYTFTPTQNIGQCALPKTVQIIVNPTIAVFNPPIPPICAGAFLAPLPTTSTNGITGSWSPPLDNTKTTIYTFTPAGGQCATATTELTIIVNPNITPTFSFITSICEKDTAPLLPTTSDNGITGTWNTPTVSNTITGTYTFTSANRQCTNPALPITVTVKPFVTPTFSFVTSICKNDTAPLLPTTSDNGITGTWNTPTVSNTATGTYTFTSANGQCTNPAPPVTVTVKPFVTPTFNPIPNVCSDSAPPSLPTISTNGIFGTWNPSTVSNTDSALYTFTPTSGVCVTTAKLNITVDKIIPVFNIVSSICANTTAPILLSSSTNGIIGTWNPTTVSNTASGTYTFTPDAGQCATTTIFNVTINPIVIPSFTAIAPICLGTVSPVLPLTSNNGITGTWNPAVVSNTTSGLYSFTPNIGECATGTTLNVTVNPNITPIFTAIAPMCSGSTSPVLPTTSTNLIIGKWNPTNVSNTTPATYTFTPTAGQCALTTTLSVIVYQSPTGFTVITTDVVNDTPNGSIEISNPINGLAPYQYSINNGSFTTNTNYPNLAPGNYTITIQDSNGCQFNKVATINSICLFPNVITPNGDTFNDTLNLNGCDVVKLELFNRFGRIVNSYNNYTNQWGGTNEKGESLPDGTYFYVAEIKGGVSKSGWVFIAE